MATLTKAQVLEWWRLVFRLGQGKEEIKDPSPAAPVGAQPLPLDKNIISAVAQEMEDWIIEQWPIIKARCETAAITNGAPPGFKFGNPAFKKLLGRFLEWKGRGE